MHNRLTECTGGSCGHGHTEAVFVHVGRYSMPVMAMSQEGKANCIKVEVKMDLVEMLYC